MRKQCALAKDILNCGTHIDSVPREIYNALEATRSASSNRDGELENRVLNDTTILKRQLDLATKLMLEQVLTFVRWRLRTVCDGSTFPGLR